MIKVWTDAAEGRVELRGEALRFEAVFIERGRFGYVLVFVVGEERVLAVS